MSISVRPENRLRAEAVVIPVRCRSLTGGSIAARVRYGTDLTDAEWALIESHTPSPRIRGRPCE